jgi:hypothetical protein
MDHGINVELQTISNEMDNVGNKTSVFHKLRVQVIYMGLHFCSHA